MKEIDFRDPSYDEIIAFVMNILESANARPAGEDPSLRAKYYEAITSVFLARRLENAAERLQTTVVSAADGVRGTLQEATHMFLDAADRSQQAATEQATRAEAYGKQLARATWTLVFATAVLAVATLVLVYYTRLMALKPAP